MHSLHKTQGTHGVCVYPPARLIFKTNEFNLMKFLIENLQYNLLLYSKLYWRFGNQTVEHIMSYSLVSTCSEYSSLCKKSNSNMINFTKMMALWSGLAKCRRTGIKSWWGGWSDFLHLSRPVLVTIQPPVQWLPDPFLTPSRLKKE
jgi:hypothetical protein